MGRSPHVSCRTSWVTPVSIAAAFGSGATVAAIMAAVVAWEISSAVPALGDIIHLYLGTGRRSRSQGYRYIGSITGDGATASFDLLNLDEELRVRVGSSLTATTTPVAGGVSEFSDNVSIRRP